jgi:hypothetical protein
MTDPCPITQEWFAEKPQTLRGQLTLDSVQAPETPAERRPATVREVVANYLHTTEGTSSGKHQSTPGER